MSIDSTKMHWRHNIFYLVVLVVIWFLVSFGCGVSWREFFSPIRTSGLLSTFLLLTLWVLQLESTQRIMAWGAISRERVGLPVGDSYLFFRHRTGCTLSYPFRLTVKRNTFDYQMIKNILI